MRSRLVLALALVTPALLGVRPATAASVYEVFWVDTVGGATIRVETQRNPAFDPQPVLLTYSPYTVHAGRLRRSIRTRADTTVTGSRARSPM